MTVKLNITSDRIQEATSLPEFIRCATGDIPALLAILPRMVVDDDNNYIVTVEHDADGDPIEYKNLADAEKMLEKIGTKRLFSFASDMSKAIRDSIVNPTRGAD